MSDIKEEFYYTVFCRVSQSHLAEDKPADSIEDAMQKADAAANDWGMNRVTLTVTHNKFYATADGSREPEDWISSEDYVKGGLNEEWIKEKP